MKKDITILGRKQDFILGKTQDIIAERGIDELSAVLQDVKGRDLFKNKIEYAKKSLNDSIII